MADESVQTIVTSPPYWGLRKYAGAQDLLWGEDRCPVAGIDGFRHEWATQTKTLTNNNGDADSKSTLGSAGTMEVIGSTSTSTCQKCGAWRGSFGLEPTIEMYVAHTVEILRECRRVLRGDGVLFWNIGDSYAGGHISYSDKRWQHGAGANVYEKELGKQDGLKPKDLCLIPARVALAAQADGWWVRSLIIWAKPNPMPESVTDRPTDAYEHILMLTKSARYFWDADAVREPNKPESIERMMQPWHGNTVRDDPLGREQMVSGGRRGDAPMANVNPGGRNLRNVWTFPTQPYKGAHFATFPEELPRRCILAATSERGACRQCGAPWERVTRIPYDADHPTFNEYRKQNASGKYQGGDGRGYGGTVSDYYKDVWNGESSPASTVGWRPTCLCKGQRGSTVH